MKQDQGIFACESMTILFLPIFCFFSFFNKSISSSPKVFHSYLYISYPVSVPSLIFRSKEVYNFYSIPFTFYLSLLNKDKINISLLFVQRNKFCSFFRRNVQEGMKQDQWTFPRDYFILTYIFHLYIYNNKFLIIITY